MKLKTAPRVIYEHNPLVEVVCQIRFERVMELQISPPAAFQANFTREIYPINREERGAALHVVFGQGADEATVPPEVKNAGIPVTYHFASEDESRRISLNAEFFAFTCTRYQRWEVFLKELTDAVVAFQEFYPRLAVNRVGLRYKDLIERESLGIADFPWKELLSPSVAGPLMDDLFDGPSYQPGDLFHSSQAAIKLEDCGLLLQTALLLSTDQEPREAFLIDADFFHEQIAHQLDEDSLTNILMKLHKNAGSLFRQCIKDPLHDALRPTPA